MPRLNLVALKRILQDLPRVPEPISDILQRRSTQLKYILTSSCVVPPPERRLSFDYRTIWMRSSNKDCFATNFFVDIPVQGRARELLKVLAEIGGYISHYSSIVATNKLRGKFIMTGVNGRQVEIAFTLSAEHEPKIQHLSMKLLPMSPGPPQPP